MSAGASHAKVALLLLGLLVGAVAGWLTRPKPVVFRVNGTQVQLPDALVPAPPSEPTTDGQGEHVLLYTLAGGMVGLLTGFAVDRRR